ncbi:MAG TPA: pantoate--beta-alanine ligase [Myxococcales bacterium]|jgi:pantoate--beta-alanine ligase|nr:pantoate--beta-alanine ligase [Myxococcales bacterium]
MIEVVRTAAEVRARVAGLRKGAKTLALVPTMGFLHEGHLSLIREGRERADVCAASIFVNPTQFGPSEDLSSYPRDERGDIEKCEQAGATLVWAPEPREVYPEGFQTFVEVTEMTRRWCGAARPGHFRGVTTVVSKLFNLFRPDVAVFGEKDFQQLHVVRRMARDLGFETEVVGMPIVREPDGLAMSSRNAYLSPDERRRALALSRAWRTAAHAHANGERSAERLIEAARAELRACEAREDYVALVDPATLEPVERIERPARMLLAAFVGKTRLIDNAPIG